MSKDNVMEIYNVVFFGHRYIKVPLRPLEGKIEKLIAPLLSTHLYVDFYMGINGEFDTIAASCVKRVQKQRGKESCSLVLALPYHVKDEKYYIDFYDEVIYPVSPSVHYKAAITQRNRILVENADLVICYIEKDSGIA